MMRPLLKRLSRVIPTSLLQRILLSRSVRENFPNAAQSPSFPDRAALWQDLFAKHLSGPLCVLEFGVWQGDSLRSFTQFNTHPDSRFFGFDSFEGLPEDWRPGFAKGAFSTQGAPPDIRDARVRFVKGWFNQTFEPFVAEQPELFASIAEGRRTLFVHFDADLFSSTLYLLAALAFTVPDYYFVFDEFHGDESQALAITRNAFGMEVEFYGHNAFPAAAGVARVSGRIRKRP